jgi:tetratricopeptide (TPR) repeat protein
MGEISRDPRQALTFFEAALAAGDRAVPTAILAERKGSYWGHYQTRMLLRARFGLATTLKDLGRVEEAEGEYRTLLALDESDHGAAAPHLLALLLETGRDAEASDLLSRFDHEGPEWAYGRTLWEFRNRTRHDAREALRAAREANPRVARLLALAVPDHGAYPETEDDDPDDASVEDDAHEAVEDAFDCATLLAPAWRSTPGAIEWLAAELARRQPDRRRRGRSRRRR